MTVVIRLQTQELLLTCRSGFFPYRRQWRDGAFPRSSFACDLRLTTTGMAIESQNQIGLRQSLVAVEQRGHPRFKLDVDIELHTRSGECLRGRTVDISESGVSALLKIEIAVNAVVQLDFSLPDCSFASEKVSVLAVVRQRNAFRYGFQFADPDATREVIRRACERLAPSP